MSAESTTERFAPGDPCGVCRFPVGPDQICGNPVYALAGKGALPKYCGADGQAEHQQQHGTPGDPAHRAELAGYPRTKHGISKERIAELAEQQTRALGVRRTLRVVAAESAPVVAAPAGTDSAASPVEAQQTGGEQSGESAPVADVPVRALAAGTGRGGLDKAGRLGELLLAAAELAAELPGEMEGLRADCEHRVAREVQRADEAVAANEIAQQELSAVQEQARATVAQAEDEVRQAHDARMRAEGELSGARDRIAALEQQLAEADRRHRAELDKVRDAADERVERILTAFGTTATATPQTVGNQAGAVAAPAPAASAPRKLTTPGRRMLVDVRDGLVQVLARRGPDGQHLGQAYRRAGANMTKAEANMLRGMAQEGVVEWSFSGAAETPDGEVAVVRLTVAGAALL
jgi:hypothetical protein